MNELFPAQALPECYPDCDESGVYHAKSGMNYSFLFFYERKFFNITYIKDTKVWVDAYWPVSIQHSCMYLACIFLGQLIMKNREKFDLRRGLIAWNTLLCAFSLMGCYRLWPEFIHAIQRHGLDHSYCVIEFVPGR
jgi:elongation of very long chain fatty acids protein 6